MIVHHILVYCLFDNKPVFFLKSSSNSLVFREMQIEIIRHCYLPIQKKKRRSWSSCNFQTLLVELEIGISTLENSLPLSSKSEEAHLYTPATPSLVTHIYPKETLACVHQNACVQMFIAVLFLTTKAWKTPKCISRGKEANFSFLQKYEWVSQT